jgi:hypothetical protein
MKELFPFCVPARIGRTIREYVRDMRLGSGKGQGPDLLSAELAKHGEARQAGELAPGRGSGFGFRQPLRVHPLMGTKCMVGEARAILGVCTILPHLHGRM